MNNASQALTKGDPPSVPELIIALVNYSGILRTTLYRCKEGRWSMEVETIHNGYTVD